MRRIFRRTLSASRQEPATELEWLAVPGAARRGRDLASLGVKADLDFSGYMLDTVVIDELNCNWKTFIEVYLEDYHVVPYHPGWAISSIATS